jgi:hypothetical protein
VAKKPTEREFKKLKLLMKGKERKKVKTYWGRRRRRKRARRAKAHWWSCFFFNSFDVLSRWQGPPKQKKKERLGIHIWH